MRILVRRLAPFVLALLLVFVPILTTAATAMAATTADVTLTATPKFIAISDNATTYDFGPVAESSTTDMPTNQIAITNTSSVTTNMSISVTGATWTGGVAWTHSDTATAGADTAGLKASAGTGLFTVIVKNGAPLNDIKTNLGATTDFDYECQLLAPTTFSDGVQKTNTVRITVRAAS